VEIMLEVLRRCWPERLASPAWTERLQRLIPAWGVDLGRDPEQLTQWRRRSDQTLGLMRSEPK